MKNDLPPLINPQDVRAMMARRDVIIVDARGGADALERYSASHLNGAVAVNLETDLSAIGPDAAQGGRHPLPDAKRFGLLLGRLGITPSTHVFVYDDKAGANAAARFWWMLRAIGHERVQVIDGGLAAIEEEKLPVVTGPPPMRQAVPPYPVSDWRLPLADIDTVDRMRADNNALVIDVREGYRYRGESEPIDAIAGHIPGAINIPYVDNLDPDGRFRSPEALAALYSPAIGSRRDAEVVVHCGSGVTACHTLLAMEVAGLPTPRLYVGSWSEWSRNNKPIATIRPGHSKSGV